MRNAVTALIVVGYFALVGLFSFLVAQTVVDYGKQVTNKPKFGRGLQTIIGSTGRYEVAVDDSWLSKVQVYPKSEPAIKAGPCKIGDTYQASWTRVITPTAIYECIPDGTGSGFRWAKIAIATDF